MKTIKQHLSELKPEHAKLALENANESMVKRKYEKKEDALIVAFSWRRTPQGADFWSDIYDQLEKGTYQKTQQPVKKSFFRRLLPWLFVLLPALSFTQIQPDKVKHFVAGAVIGGTTQYLTYKATGNKNTAFFVGLGVSTLAGVAKELYDKQGHGTPSVKDAVWTSLGGVSSCVTLRITIK